MALQRTRDNDEQIRHMMVTLFPYTANIPQKNIVSTLPKNIIVKKLTIT